jgi:hypothetical protein
MKKTLLIAFFLMFGMTFQTLAVSNNGQPQGGSKPASATQDDTVIATTPAQGTQAGNVVNTGEQNAVKNQGENTQIQTQEQNAVQTQDSGEDKTSKGKDTNPSEQKRSQVANAVQTMLQIADRDGGVGKQVKVIAQTQNQNQVKLEQSVEKIQSRGGLVKFFIGANYSEIRDAQKTLDQNKEQIRQLNQIRTQLSNQGDQQQLAEQIKVLEQSNQGIETILANNQSGFSVFGWLNKLIF